MKEHFVPWYLADKVKELGFDMPCIGYYNKGSIDNPELITSSHQLKDPEDFHVFYNQKDCEIYAGGVLAPMWTQIFDWFRDTHLLHSEIKYAMSPSKYPKSNFWYRYEINGWNERGLSNHPLFVNSITDIPFEKIYDARITCLEKLIELTKK